MRRLRNERGWSVAQLAEKITQAGVPISSGALTKCETAGRQLTLLEALAVARLFAMTVEELAAETPCSVCVGSPPAGFTCNDCGRTGGPR